MPAGVAFDGSPWVTAASSVGLGEFFLGGAFNVWYLSMFSVCHNVPVRIAVVMSLGATVGGGILIARKIATEVRYTNCCPSKFRAVVKSI